VAGRLQFRRCLGQDLRHALEGKELASGILVGTYQR